jgi:hypothetical protein
MANTSEITVGERTKALLAEPLLHGQDMDAKIRALLEAEYLRRLQQGHRQDRILRSKYGMSFDDFLAQRVVAQRGYTWDVEQDAVDWETAIGGIATFKKKLHDLRELGNPDAAQQNES